MPLRAVPASNPAVRTPRRRTGDVEKAAKSVLADIDSDHAAADLLVAVAKRLARDIDDADSVRDRVAASRELLAVVAALDTAVIPPKMPSTGEGGAPDDDDPFEIGSVPPRVVDSPQSEEG